MAFHRDRTRERLRGPKAQESTRPRPELKPQGSKKGYGFSGGRKPLKHGCKVVRFCNQVQERREGWETFLRPLERNKALKGEA